MEYMGWTKAVVLSVAGSCILYAAAPAVARQNIIIGEVSTGFDYQDRSYDEQTAVTDEILLFDDRTGDSQQYFITPRLTFTSTDVTDLLSVTYAPRFNYDDVYDEADVDHDFGAILEKDLARNWSIRLNEHYFLGDDPVREDERRLAELAPPAEEVATAGPAAVVIDESLDEQTGRRRFYRNDVSLLSEYMYREDSTLGLGYTYGILRNDDDQPGGYAEYDRHDALLRLSYRFNRQWSGEVEGHSIKGTYEDDIIDIALPAETIEATVPDDDLQEYTALGRITWDRTPHDHFFTSYGYDHIDYDHPLRDDSTINDITLGWTHDFSSQFHLTLSGGPSFIERDNADDDSSYNAYVGLTRDFVHSSLRFYGEKGYEERGFDGQRSGLNEFWRSGIDFTHQLTENLSTTLSASYRDRTLTDPVAVGDLTDLDVAELPADIEYDEKFYEAGLSVSYTFKRWYTLSAGYRYANYDVDLSDLDDYDEHRFYVQLAAAKELFRW